MVKNLPANARDERDVSSIPGSGTSPVVGNSNPFQYFYLENSMTEDTWQTTVHGVVESDMTEHSCTHEVGII